jgi:NAD(P)H-quinone oxidoreductase subunit 3
MVVRGDRLSATAPPQGKPSNGAGRTTSDLPATARSERRLTGIWYIVGFAFAGVSFVFLTFGAAWLLTHRNRGDAHKGLPYESGIDTYGDTHGRFGLSFYIYALLFVAFDIEVIFIYLWAIVFRDLLIGGFVTMLVFVGVLLLGLAYAWRKGVLNWK